MVTIGIKTIVLTDHQFNHGDLWFLQQGITMSLNHHPHQIDIVVTATVNQPPIIVTDVIGLLHNDAVAVMMDIILQQMNLMNT